NSKNQKEFCAVLFEFDRQENKKPMRFISQNLTDFCQNFSSSTSPSLIFFTLIFCFWQQVRIFTPDLDLEKNFANPKISDYGNLILITSDEKEILENIREALEGKNKSKN